MGNRGSSEPDPSTRYATEIKLLAANFADVADSARRRRVAVVSTGGSGRSTLIHQIQCVADRAHNQTFSDGAGNATEFRKDFLYNVAAILHQLMDEIGDDLQRTRPKVWTRERILDCKHVSERLLEPPEERTEAYVAQHFHVPLPPAPPAQLTDAELEAHRDPMYARRLRYEYDIINNKYDAARREWKEKRAASYRPVYKHEVERELNEMCDAVLADPIAMRWFESCGDRSGIGASGYATCKFRSFSGYPGVGRRAAYFDRKAWDDGQTKPDISVERVLVAHGFNRFDQRTTVTVSPMWNPREWVSLQFNEFATWNHSVDRMHSRLRNCSTIVFTLALDQYDTASQEPKHKSYMEHNLLLFMSIVLTLPLVHDYSSLRAKIILVLTRLDVFEHKYGLYGLPPKPEPEPFQSAARFSRYGYEFFKPLIESSATAAAGDEKRSASSSSVAVPLSSDAVIRYIASRFRELCTSHVPGAHEWRLPVVACNVLHRKSAEFVLGLLTERDHSDVQCASGSPAAGDGIDAPAPEKWIHSRADFAEEAMRALTAAPSAAAAAESKRDAKKSQSPPLPAVVAAPAKPNTVSWMDVRQRVHAFPTYGDNLGTEFPMHVCPFLKKDKKPERVAKLLAAGLPPNHPVVPRALLRQIPLCDADIPTPPDALDWKSAAAFDQFLHQNVIPIAAPGVNLWILRSPRVWSPDRAVHTQFPAPFRLAVRTLLLIWSRRRRPPPTAAVTSVISFSVHPLSRLPRDIILRIISYFAELSCLGA